MSLFYVKDTLEKDGEQIEVYKFSRDICHLCVHEEAVNDITKTAKKLPNSVESWRDKA